MICNYYSYSSFISLFDNPLPGDPVGADLKELCHVAGIRMQLIV